MAKVIGIAQFRANMKMYTDKAEQERGAIFRLGTDRDAILSSEETIKRLQVRHHLNAWMQEAFGALGLGNYMTVAAGKNTAALPLNMVMGLAHVFALSEEVFRRLAQPSIKSNAANWGVAAYVTPAAKGERLETSGTFAKTYDVIRELLGDTGLWFLADKSKMTLRWFFLRLHAYMEDGRPFAEPSLAESQDAMVREIVTILSSLMAGLLGEQSLDWDDAPEYPDYLKQAMRWVYEWYGENIGEIPARRA